MAKRIVIKIGTNLLAEKLCGLRADFISKIAKEIAELKKKGNEVLIVTSGAIGAGCTELGVKKSREVEVRQALAAVGQSYVMRAYADAFSKFKLKVAQILLTYDDFSNRKRYLNLKKAIDKLLELKVIPIINENDPISVDEIGATFGDNDKLSALVASKVNAELLILLTDIDGFYDKNPKTNKLLKSKISKGLEMSEKQSFSEHTPKSSILDESRNFQNKEKRNIIITPDSSHGTNPASSTMCGFRTITVHSNENGQVNIEELKSELTKDVAAIMLTIPNTLGIFEEQILEITKLCHDNGTLVYMDGANMNALLGIAKPADFGVDVLHLNLHKTFSTPHGCGGPGSGPVGVKEFLKEYLPLPSIEKIDKEYQLNNKNKKSIGKVKAFYGNFGVMVKAYSYIKAIGADGLRQVAENAVLNANYMKEKLKGYYKLPYNRLCKHEFVLSDEGMPNDVATADIAKRLLDYGFHPPTIYFPLIVHGAIMIEPNETESKETMDSFIEAMIKIKDEADSDPEMVKGAPHTTVVKRLDAVKAARELDLRWKSPKESKGKID